MKYVLPIQPVNRNNQRMHWAKLHRLTRAERHAACLITRSVLDASATAKIERLGAIVRLTKINKRRFYKGDNLNSSLKAIRDGIADAIGINDGDDRLEWEYDQRTEGRYAVEVEVMINED